MSKIRLHGAGGAHQMRAALDALTGVFPNLSVTILIGPFDAPSVHNYVSNSQREDMIKVLRETADRLEKRMDFPTPEDN